MKRPALFLDRDGVLNRAWVRDGVPYPPASVQELEILPGVPEALTTLKEIGYALVAVTNQPDVARGTQSRQRVDEMNEHLRQTLRLDAILTCFHDDADNCDCRKPRPGLILQAARELGLDLRASFMVGDRWKDVEAGRRAGCRTFYVEQGYREPAPAASDFRVTSLGGVAEVVLELRGSK